MKIKNQRDVLLRQPAKFDLEFFRQMLHCLVQNGGPAVSEYKELTDLINQAADAVKRGELSADELRKVWGGIGDALTSTKTMQGFVWMKPHGYAGDFEIIDRIYQHWISPDPRLAKWDEYFHAQTAPCAVRNRKAYFHSWLRQWEDQNQSHKIRVLNIGCGPNRDVFEYLDNHQNSRAVFECVDNEPKAIAYAKNVCRGFLDRIEFQQANAFRYQPSRPPNLIWSAGLFDYLNNRLATLLLRRLWRWLPPGGELVIGNFSPANSTRTYMEFMGSWILHHRTESDLVSLARLAGIPDNAIHIEHESEQVNLFLHAKRIANGNMIEKDRL
jgi:SAM-dependent methyltransferase